MGRKVGAVPFLGAGTTSNTMLPRPRTTSVPSGILINPCSHFATTDMGGKIGGCAPFLELDPHLHKVARAEAYLHAKFHLDPFNRLANVTDKQAYRRARQTTDR